MMNLIAVFADTTKQVETNPLLQASLQQTIDRQYVITNSSQLKPLPDSPRYTAPAAVLVSPRRSFEAAMHYRGKKVCVLNFASATHPGGGVAHGARAQEECLCRCSTLYFALKEERVCLSFHQQHINDLKSGRMDSWYNDDCIYSPDVMIFKTDDGLYQRMDEQDFVSVDVITCAAPNLGGFWAPHDITEQKIAAVHRSRAERILQLAASEGAEVLILGAFGCGAFHNPPEIVAATWAEAVKAYRRQFETIEFAIVSNKDRPSHNYSVFHRIMTNAFPD